MLVTLEDLKEKSFREYVNTLVEWLILHDSIILINYML